jgi:hypothetical protein
MDEVRKPINSVNIKRLIENQDEGVGCILLVQNEKRWTVLANMAMNMQMP